MTKYLRRILLVGIWVTFSTQSFSQKEAAMAEDIKEEILTVLNNYFAAVKERNPQKAISYYANTEDFLVYSDGKASNYEEYAKSVTDFLPKAKKVDIGFDTVYVRRISKDAALVTGAFHENFTDADNKDFAFSVTGSIILLKKQGQWKITYATAVYQPVIKQNN